MIICYFFQVSAYLDKFVARKEKSFIQPVIDWEAGLFGRLTATLSQSRSEQGGQFILHLEKFVKFVIFEIESNAKSYGSLHWWPYTRLCDLCHIKYDFIGKVETWHSDISHLIQSDFFEFEVKSLLMNKYNRNQEKTTEDTCISYFKQLNPQLIIKLYNLCKSDFLIGGYDYPQNYIDMAKKIKAD